MIDIERLKSRLAALDLTANAASQAAGLGRDYVRDILRGRIQQPSAFRLKRLSEVLKCAPGYLMGADEGAHIPNDDTRADDREIALAHAAETSRSIIARDHHSHLEFGHAYINLLDSVSDRSLAELAYVAVNSMIYSEIDDATKLTDAEKRVLLGEPPGLGIDPFFERRAVLAKVLGLITQPTYVSVMSLAAFWDVARDLPPEDVFKDEHARNTLAPLMKVSRMSFTPEAARVAIIGAVTRFIAPDSTAIRDFDRDGQSDQDSPDGTDEALIPTP